MAWEKRGGKAFYYRSARDGVRVKKIYCGSGALGHLAAEIDARRRQQRQAEHIALLTETTRLENLEVRSKQLRQICELLADATLVLADYHRPNRVAWRRSRGTKQSTHHSH